MLTLPTAGEMPQLRAVLLVPVTFAVKVIFCPAVSDPEAGETDTATGISEMTALALLVGYAWLVAVKVTVPADGTGLGAV